MAMNEISIDTIFNTPLEPFEKEEQVENHPLADFKKVLSKSIDEIDLLLKQADQYTQEMVLGKRDIHEAMIAVEQAHISLRMMIQVRNKMISAYEEIMRIQI